MTRIIPKKNRLLDAIENSTNPSNESLVDYIALQLSNESLIYKRMPNENPYETAYVYDRQEHLTFGLWSNNSSSLKSVFTQSNGITDYYYKNVYLDSQSTSSIQFSISYGDFFGSYETTRSFANYDTGMRESKAIYTQFNNMLNETKKSKFQFNYPSWQNAIQTASRIYGYGENISGSYGNGSENGTNFTMKLDDYKQVFAGNAYSTALKKDGTIVVWGDNTYGKLGLGAITNKYYPTEISYSGQWDFLSSGPEHSLAIKKDGTLWAWGRNNHGQLGNGTLTNSNLPIQIDSGSWDFVSAGNRYSCGIKSDGTLWTWGDNAKGQLGNGDPNIEPIIPAQINVGYSDWVKVYASSPSGSDGFTFGIKTDGKLYGWGANDLNQLGLDTDTTDKYSPTLIDNGPWELISPGGTDTYGIKSTKELYVWGYVPVDASTTTTPSKIVSSGDDWIFVDNSLQNTVGIKTNGNVYYWGTDSSAYPNTLAYNKNTEEDKVLNYNITNCAVSDYYDETSDIISSGHYLVLSEYDVNKTIYLESDFVYVLTTDSNRLLDGIEPGMWELSLSAVDELGNLIDSIEPIKLIDDSSLSNKTIDRKDVYNIYSGSLTDGLYTGSFSMPFGLFYPNNGTIVLNGISLYSFNSILTDRNSNPLDYIYTSISGAIELNSESNAFKATSFQRLESIYAFARILSDEFNYSNNPSYKIHKNGNIRNEIIQNANGMAYFTTVGLYNDEKELLAVAKLSRPILKTPGVELVIKIKIRN